MSEEETVKLPPPSRRSDPRKGETKVVDGKTFVRDRKGEWQERKTMVPAHGVGNLRVGNPGNSGGTGRKPDEARRYFLELLNCAQEEAANRLTPEEVKKMTDQDLAKFIDVFGKYGVGTKATITGPDDGPLRHGIMAMPPLDPVDGETSGDDS